jgi:hypothetical protein
MQGEGRGRVDLAAFAGTQSHAQQSRATPRGRLVATSERAAEPRRHPSLVRRRFLPRQPRASVGAAVPAVGGLAGILRRRERPKWQMAAVRINRPKWE